MRFRATEVTGATTDVSPDGRLVLFDLLGQLYEVSIDGGVAHRVSDGRAWHRAGRYSPDGNTICVVRDGEGRDDLWLIQRDGSAPPIKLNTPAPKGRSRVQGAPAWSRDGTELLFGYGDGMGNATVGTINHASGPAELAEPDPPYANIFPGALTPDGSGIIATRRRSAPDGPGRLMEIVRFARRGGPWIALKSPAPGEQHYSPALSPDGATLAYFSQGATGRVVLRTRPLESDSGADRGLIELPDEDDPSIGFSATERRAAYAFTPDGHHVVLSSGGKLLKVRVSDGAAETIPFVAEVELSLAPMARAVAALDDGEVRARDIQWPQLSADGRTLAFSAFGYVWVQSLPNGDPQRLTDADAETFELMPTLSADGSQVAYVEYARRGAKVSAGRLMTASVGGGRRSVYEGDGDVVAPAWSPDNRSIAFALNSEASAVFLLKLTGAPPQKLMDIGRPGVGVWSRRLSFSSDGSHVFFGGDSPTALSRINIATLEVRLVATVEAAAQGVLASPDGRRAVVLGPDDDLWLMSPEGGREGETTKFGDPGFWRVTKTGARYACWRDERTIEFSCAEHIYQCQVETGACELVHTVDLRAPRNEGRGVTALVGGRIITMAGARGVGQVIERGVLVIRGRRIEAVGEIGAVDIPVDAELVDSSGQTIMPGMIDTHYHPYDHRVQGLFSPTAHEVVADGITTAFSPAPPYWNEGLWPVPELREIGRIPGPRWNFAGVSPYADTENPGFFGGSYEDALRISRNRKALGATTIKEQTTPRADQRRWFADAARALNMAIISHVETQDQAIRQILDGYTCLEHVPFTVPMAGDLKRVLIEAKGYWTPTITDTAPGVASGGETSAFFEAVGIAAPSAHDKWRYLAEQRLPSFPPDTLGRQDRVARVSASLAELMRQGLRVSLSAHDPPAYLLLLEAWVLERAGADRRDVLRALTASGAEKIGVSDELGSIEAGKIADLLVMDGNPLDSIVNIARLRQVVSDGLFIDPTAGQ